MLCYQRKQISGAFLVKTIKGKIHIKVQLFFNVVVLVFQKLTNVGREQSHENHKFFFAGNFLSTYS